MARTDMSPRAVTVRLLRVAQLRDLALSLGRRASEAERGHGGQETGEAQKDRGPGPQGRRPPAKHRPG